MKKTPKYDIIKPIYGGIYMKRLPNTELTQQDIERICNNPFQTGGEAVIATTDKPNSLYKIFIDYEDYDAVDELGLVSTEAITDMSDNKFSKIKKLYTIFTLFYSM